MKINLSNGYYIDSDPLNYILKQSYTGKTNDGKEKECSRTCGYYGSIRNAVEGFIAMNQKSLTAEYEGDLRRYVGVIEKLNETAVSDVEKAIGGNATCAL